MKLAIILLALVFIGHQSEAQRRLKMTKEKMETYSSYAASWTGWPSDYTYFQSGSEPILELTNLDDNGVNFEVDSWINGAHNSVNVSYVGYDATNNWYKYSDANGDQVCIKGATMSYLAQNGWPSNRVQIYLWMYSQNTGIVLE